MPRRLATIAAVFFAMFSLTGLYICAPYIIHVQPFLWLQHDGTATIVAALIQAIATAAAILGTVWQTRKTFERLDSIRREEAIDDARKIQRQATELTRLISRRLSISAEIMNRNQMNDRDVVEMTTRSLNLLISALDRFQFEQLNPKKMERFEAVFGLTQNACHELAEFSDFIKSNSMAHSQRQKCADEIKFYAEKIKSIHSNMHFFHEYNRGNVDEYQYYYKEIYPRESAPK